MFTIRKAKISDAEKIKKLIDFYAKRGVMLFRPIYEIYSEIRNYFLAEANKKIVGCCALHIFGKEYKPGGKEYILAEIRSLVVTKNFQKKGIGTKLIEGCIDEAKKMEINKVFILTTQENIKFFKKLGFKLIKKSELTQKIWQECVKCPRFPFNCNEIPLILEI
jgi:amino-acid N-acetyltransferase